MGGHDGGLRFSKDRGSLKVGAHGSLGWRCTRNEVDSLLPAPFYKQSGWCDFGVGLGKNCFLSSFVLECGTCGTALLACARLTHVVCSLRFVLLGEAHGLRE